MSIARIENGAIIERRNIQMAEVPEHKRHFWVPMVEEGAGPIVTEIIEADRVRVVRNDRGIEDVKAEFLSAVDADAERVRLRYVTAGAGMAMTYQEKHAQARAVDAMGQAAANALTEAEREEQFPTLSASVGIEGATLWDCAQLVITNYEQFADLSRVIERTRLQGKKAISDASDVAAVRAAYEAITWTV
jgi:hypothetical protein